MLLFVFVLSLVAQACSASPTAQQPNQKTDQHVKSIFILAGQSNMAGRGGVVNDTTTGIVTWDGVVPPKCRPNPSVFRLDANLRWVKAREPLHADIDVGKTNGIGPAMAFANAVLANHSSTVGRIGLVPCAIGGTNITQWARGSFMYNQMIGRAKVSLQNGGSIRALLWYQGESDTARREDARSYKNRLETFLGDVRLDLQSPDLPIIQVALASGEEASLIEIVREAQLGVDFLNVRTVDAKGLPLEPDGLHLTTPAQVQLGKMLADAYLQFLPSAISHAPSSMAGRGGVSRGKWDGNVPTECSPNPSILRLSAQLIWEQAHEPLHADIDLGKTCGIGPGMTFANEVLRAKGSGFGEVGLVPCAVGGTRIGEWGKGTRLYSELVRRARESVRGGGVIRALLWFQGESDTVRKEDAEGYKGNFEKLVLDLRSGLHLPNLPVIQVALASGEGKFVEIVRKGQLDVKLPNVKCVDAKGLRLKEDGLHLTTGSEETNEQGAVEIKVRTVDYRSPAGEDKQPKKEKVEVVHEIRDGGGSDFVDLDAIAAGSTGETNEDIKVQTVDYRSPAGEDKEAKEDDEVVHEIRDGGAKSEGVHPFAGAAAAVANTIQSAKDAISGGAKTSKDDKTAE
ncbi:unnamed protein product [Malus baccata var. baccata]